MRSDKQFRWFLLSLLPKRLKKEEIQLPLEMTMRKKCTEQVNILFVSYHDSFLITTLVRNWKPSRHGSTSI